MQYINYKQVKGKKLYLKDLPIETQATAIQNFLAGNNAILQNNIKKLNDKYTELKDKILTVEDVEIETGIKQKTIKYTDVVDFEFKRCTIDTLKAYIDNGEEFEYNAETKELIIYKERTETLAEARERTSKELVQIKREIIHKLVNKITLERNKIDEYNSYSSRELEKIIISNVLQFTEDGLYITYSI